MTTENLGYGTGRRKTSVARVYLRAGNGNITINIPDEILLQTIKSPLDVCNCLNKYDVLVNVYGGGISGQAGAIRHGLSRALADADESNRSVLGANGFLTRDSRMVERKKYGQRGARRRFQFSKR